MADVVPGMDGAADYAARGGSMGAILGRYGNIIGHGRFDLGGRTHHLDRNLGPHTMHGGGDNFGQRIWAARRLGEHAVALRLVSPDGDLGWPGRVAAQVVYRLTGHGGLSIEMTAVPDRDTYLNLIFHGYWNLAGHAAGDVHDHILRIEADDYTPKDTSKLPTGERRPVVGTPLDFRVAKPIGRDIAATGRGYADNFCLRRADGRRVVPAARLLDPESGRALTLATDQPGMQVFTGNAWTDLQGKGGAIYQRHSAVALETQLFPNTPNVPAFAPRSIGAGEIYRHRMRFRFLALRKGDHAGFLAADPASNRQTQAVG